MHRDHGGVSGADLDAPLFGLPTRSRRLRRMPIHHGLRLTLSPLHYILFLFPAYYLLSCPLVPIMYMYLVDPGVGRGPYHFSHHIRLVALSSLLLSRLYISSPITPDRSYCDRLWALSKCYIKTHTSDIISKPHSITYPLIARLPT